MIVLPTRSALPPLGLASVLPQTEQEISDEALLKIIVSFPQSLQLTFRKSDPDIYVHLSTSSNFFALFAAG